jgi:hypothetical protein
MRTTVLVLLVAFAASVRAQPVGDCATGTAEADLDINDVLARVFNGGNLFFGNTTTSGDGYLVPKAAGLSPIFAANLWVGGQVSGELRAAGSQYQRFPFAPGPLDTDGDPPADCAAFDRIYRVSRGDVARYHQTGEATDDLRDWPVDLGAPVLGGDGVAGNYNLAGGDEPAISGEQMAWWVMNDVGLAGEFDRTPLPVEVRVSAFAVPSTVRAIDQATLYRYEITFRGEQPLDSAYVGLWMDVDLGDASDDFIGTDTTLDMSFVYGGSEDDDVYGVPPAAGPKLLRGPVGLPNGIDDDGDGSLDEAGERLGVTSSSCYFDAPVFTPPAERYYNCLQGRWFSGEPLITHGLGYPWEEAEDVDTTTIAFPGDPVAGAFWSEVNADGEGNANPPADRWLSLFSGPFRMEPGETVEVVYAIPFAQGTDRFDSIVELRGAARIVQNAYDVGFFEPQRVAPPPVEPEAPEAFALSRPFPNPFRSSAAFTLTVPEGARAVHLAVYDVLGREVAVLTDGALLRGEHPFTLDGAVLPAGVYFVRLATGRQTESLTVIHLD